jgi:hypothetical protein
LIFKIERRLIMAPCGTEVVARRVPRGPYLLDKGDARAHRTRQGAWWMEEFGKKAFSVRKSKERGG